MEKLEKNHISGQFSKGGIDTKQSGTGTISVLCTGTNLTRTEDDKVSIFQTTG